jgi:hypothetical protein
MKTKMKMYFLAEYAGLIKQKCGRYIWAKWLAWSDRMEDRRYILLGVAVLCTKLVLRL